jgi:DNA-binding CsgD family transcriptional regulator
MTREQREALAKQAALSPTELAVLEKLAVKGRQALRLEFLAAGKSPRTIDSHLKNIRRKLADAGVEAAAVRAILGPAL